MPGISCPACMNAAGAKKIASRPPLMLRIGGRNIHLKDAAWKLAGLDIGMSV